MNSKIAVVLIHGVRVTTSSFAEPFQEDIEIEFNKQLQIPGTNSQNCLEFKSIYWSEELQRREIELLNKMFEADKLKLPKWRERFLGFAGEAMAYLNPNGEVRNNIYNKFSNSLKYLSELTGENAPLCLIAHSLGGIITYNYVAELQNCFYRVPNYENRELTNIACKSALERGDTLANIYFMGVPLSTTSLGCQGDVFPQIIFPSPRVDKYLPKFKPKWYNYYYSSDILATPMKPFGTWFANNIDDQPISLIDPGDRWNLLSHSKYWNDKMLAKKIGISLADLWLELYCG